MKEFQACNLMVITNAYDYSKKIYMNTGDNLFCPKHQFKNEEVLKKEAVTVDFETIQDAMESINKAKEVKVLKGGGNRFIDLDDEDEINYNRL
jgi:hypothetical protein